MFNVGIFYILAILAVIITNFMDMAIAKIKSKYLLKINNLLCSPSKKPLSMELGTIQFIYIKLIH